MGAFHEGHLSLMRAARHNCDVVVVSLFVNPTQFGEAADLAKYPRDEQRDLASAAREDVDFVFASECSGDLSGRICDHGDRGSCHGVA